MKITIKPKIKIEEKITFDDIEPGVVFEYNNGAIVLMLDDNETALLKYSNGDDWFTLDDQSMKHHGTKILGRLDEIIVVEE